MNWPPTWGGFAETEGSREWKAALQLAATGDYEITDRDKHWHNDQPKRELFNWTLTKAAATKLHYFDADNTGQATVNGIAYRFVYDPKTNGLHLRRKVRPKRAAVMVNIQIRRLINKPLV
jgi:hypothetical protein